MNKPKAYDNGAVQSFINNYYSAGELCRELPLVDDILSGVMSLKTAGNTATRSLSRKTLFHILQTCPVVDVEAISRVTGGRYAYSTVAEYASLARVTSRALAAVIPTLPKRHSGNSSSQARLELDAPYLMELQRLGLV